MKLEHFLTPYAKINTEWIKDLNVRPDTIILLEENIGKTLFDINHSKIFFDPPPSKNKNKHKNRNKNKWHLIKFKRFCTAKETINKKDNPQNGRKYLQTKQQIKDLSPKYINSLWSSISKKRTIQLKKGQNS